MTGKTGAAGVALGQPMGAARPPIGAATLATPVPVDRPRNWLAQVNAVMDEEELHDVQQSLARGVPLGQETWKTRVAHRLGLGVTLRPRGRPRKTADKSS